jgi:mono/diheme cytochrome c family protein
LILLIAAVAVGRQTLGFEPPRARSGAAQTGTSQVAISLFRDHCMECHDGDGRGKSGRELFRTIPDFTEPRWQSSQTDDQISRAIIEGSGKSMPSMKGKLSRTDIPRLIHLVRGFAGGRQVIHDDEPVTEPEHAATEPKVASRRSSPPRREAGSVDRGMARLLFQKSCRVCHGADGKGDAIRTNMPEIPDFSLASWQDRRSRSQLTASILEGKGRHMPAFRDKLTSKHSRALADFIRAFGPHQPRLVENGAEDDFDARFAKLQQELKEYQRQYRTLSTQSPPSRLDSPSPPAR